MISRYTRKEMGDLWSDTFKYDTWLKIEILACEKLADLSQIPKNDLKIIKENAKYDAQEIKKIEEETKHDVIAFLTSVANAVGPSSRFIHLGLTSSDILDTALAFQLKLASEIIIGGAIDLATALREKAIEFKKTPIMGRSHGIHAEPTTLGLKFLLFYKEMERNIERLEIAKEAISIGKLSGAVGNFANIDPEVEKYVCQKLGLKPAVVSSQVVQRDGHAQFFTTLAILGGTLEKIATEIRHLQRTEVGELCEGFEKGQKGSSAMPHKKNPIGSENITGISRILRANAIAALENIALWHERDISHSSVERIIAPDSTIIADYALFRMKKIIKELVINQNKMMENINLTKGLCFSGRVLLDFVKSGITREDAYKLIQINSTKTISDGTHLKENLLDDKELNKLIGKKHLEKILNHSFDINYYFKNVDYVFKKECKK